MTQLTSITIPELLAELADEYPERIAFSGDASCPGLSFGSLWQRVMLLAAALHELDVRPGERVAIALPNCIDWSVWEYASQIIGALPVGLGLQWSADHVSAVLVDCEPSVLVLADVEALHSLPPEVLVKIRHVCLRDGACAKANSQSGFWMQSDLLSRANLPRPSSVCRSLDPATIVYTSGSTGRPKGVMHTHARVMSAVSAIVDLFPELHGGRLALSWMPMEHLFQRMLNVVALASGMETSILSDPRDLLSAVRRLQPTFLAGVPVIFEQLLRAATADPASFDAWRRALKVMIVGSAPISRDVLDQLARMGFPVVQAYSTSECLVPIASNTLSANRPGSVGKPVSSYELRLSDAGEILVRGPGVFEGYYGQDVRQSAALFDQGGFYNTGDVGHLDADGYLFITGRSSDLIKTSNGRKISPVEVETIYRQSPLIEQMVVSGHGRRHLVALVQLEATWAADLRRRFSIADDHSMWADDVRIVDAVLAEMQRFESKLDGYKRVRRISVLPQPLSVEAGELTATLKLRREVVEHRHRNRLQQLGESV